MKVYNKGRKEIGFDKLSLKVHYLLIIDSMPLLSLLFRKKKVCDCPKA